MPATKTEDVRKKELDEIRAALEGAGAPVESTSDSSEFGRAGHAFVRHGRLAARLRIRLPERRTARVTLTPLAGVPSGVVVVGAEGHKS